MIGMTVAGMARFIGLALNMGLLYEMFAWLVLEQYHSVSSLLDYSN